MNDSIGVVGVGLMGSAFCERLASKNYRVTAFNRTKRQEHADLASSGVNVVYDVEQVVRDSAVIILMVSDAQALREVLHDANLAYAAGKIFIQMGTIAPHESVEVSAIIERSGSRYIEATVMGSAAEVKSGTLIAMVGGDPVLFQQIEPILTALASSIRFTGEVGSAAALKLAMNQLTAALTSAFSISLAFCIENGVDVDVFMGTLRESALYAKVYDKKLSKYLNRDFGNPNFSPKHLLKDVSLFIAGARNCKLETSAVEGVERIASQAVASGFSQLDYSSIYNVIHPERSS
jgi:3-hydroxyisobutyrate dehydrogenase